MPRNKINLFSTVCDKTARLSIFKNTFCAVIEIHVTLSGSSS